MTDKEKLIKIKSLADKMYDAAFNMTTDASLLRKAMDEYRQFIINECHKEEPVSEDLEEACEQLAENARKHKAETSSPFFSQTDYRQGVMDGAKWQEVKDDEEKVLTYKHGFEDCKEQMMAKAIDAQCFGFQGAALFSFRLPADNYLVGSKVKVILINED